MVIFTRDLLDRINIRVEWKKNKRDEHQISYAYGRNGQVSVTGLDIVESSDGTGICIDVITSRGNISNSVSIGVPKDKSYLYELAETFIRLGDKAEGDVEDNAVIGGLDVKWSRAKELIRNPTSYAEFLFMSRAGFMEEYRIDPITMWLMELELEVSLYTLNKERGNDENVEDTLP